jgi:hypothetical protein
MRPVRSPPGTLADRSAREKRSKHPGYLWFTEAAPETTVKRIRCFGASLMFVSMTEMAVVSGTKMSQPGSVGGELKLSPAAEMLRSGHVWCRAVLKWVFLNLWAGQWLGRNKAFYGPLF